MAPYSIRLIGDPVLKQRASEVEEIDGKVARLINDMFVTLDESDTGIGLAAPQIGVQKRVFVYELDGRPGVLINPEIRESAGEWNYTEGCLSIPDLYFDIVRPKEIYIVGRDLEGNEVSIEADEISARLFQHELDHLDGILMLEHLDPDQLREAKRSLRQQALDDPDEAPVSGLRLL